MKLKFNNPLLCLKVKDTYIDFSVAIKSTCLGFMELLVIQRQKTCLY